MNPFGRFISLLIALLLIFAGVALLLSNLGFLLVDPFRLIADFWPVILIIIGLYFIWLRLRPAPKPKTMTLSEAVGEAKKADVTIEFGAGELRIAPLTQGDNVFEGTFQYEADKFVRRTGDTAEVKLRRSPSSWVPPFTSWTADVWRIGLTTKIPLVLRLNTGASRVFVDLKDNLVDFVELNTGASDVTLNLPKASGFSRVVVKGGAADIRIEVPQGVVAKIRSTGALSSLKVDQDRFPKQDSVYVSPDYDSVQNKVDIEINTGVASVRVY